MKTAAEIYNLHLEAFKAGRIQIDSINPKFVNKSDLVTYLQNGEILPIMFNKSVEYSQSITEQMFIYSILRFSSVRTENKCRVKFIIALSQLGIK